MALTYLSLSLFAAVALAVQQQPPATASQPLRPIVGKELQILIAGSVISEGNDFHPSAGGEWYRADGQFWFIGSEVWSTRAPYTIDTDRVCIITQPRPVCYAFFKNARGRYFQRDLTWPAGTYRLVSIAADKAFRH
jgi:hypothetical protein